MLDSNDKSKVLLSVVIPTYNSGRYLVETLDSLLSQSLPEVEIIVVDDGSDDDTVQLIQPFRERIIYHYQTNGGLAHARNTGMGISSGEFIAWIDADDLCSPDRLAMQVDYLARNSSVQLIASDFVGFDCNGLLEQNNIYSYYQMLKNVRLDEIFNKRLTIRSTEIPYLSDSGNDVYNVYSGHVWQHLVFGNFLHPPTVMIRADAARRAGPLREDIPTCEDWEFFIRVAKLGMIAFVDSPLIKYRYHPEQMSSATSSLKKALSCLRVLKLLMADNPQFVESNTKRFADTQAEFHMAAAYAAAESSKRTAFKHLFSSLKCGGLRRLPSFGFNLVRIVAAGRLLNLYRQLTKQPST